MSKNKSKRAKVFMTIVFACIVLCGMGNKAKAVREIEKTDAYYKDMESNLRSDLRVALENRGYENAGVMVTKVIEEDGSRKYCVSIHHKYLSSGNEARKEELNSLVFSITDLEVEEVIIS